LLLSRILDHAEHHPNRIAIGSDGREINYAEFAKTLLKIRARIIEALPPAPGIALLNCGSLANQWFLNIALRSLGITTAIMRDYVTADKLAQLPGTMFVCTSQDVAAAVRRRWPDMPILAITKASVDAATGDDPQSISGETRFGDNIEFTSGSTGDPKILIRSGAAVEAFWTRTAAEFHINQNSVFHLQNLAAFTAVGGKLPLTCWAMGGSAIFDHRTDWLLHLFDLPINRLFAPPALIKVLASRTFPNPPAGLQIYCGGGFLAGGLVTDLRKRLPSKVFLNYGGTEFGVRLQNEIETSDDAVWLRPTPNNDLRLVDDTGQPARDGEEAMIQVKRHSCDPIPLFEDKHGGPAVAIGEFFSTNDLGIRRADGRIRLVGRAGETLNVGGQKRSLGVLEQRARDILGVESLCLLVRQADNGEDYLTVAVEGDQTIDKAAVNTFLKDLGAKFYRTEFRRFFTFPREASGMQKVDRRQLQRLIEQPK